MPQSLDKLQILLLNLISTRCRVEEQQVVQLGEDDWGILLSLMHKHRLAPLIHWRLTHERSDLPVPAHISAVLNRAFRKSALRALLMQRELLTLGRILNAAGIPSIALKGSYLAYTVYPNAALRPMRDLDVLVASESAMDAYQALLNAGYSHWDEMHGDPTAALAVRAHLPPLRTPSGNAHVELHVRLLDVDSIQNICVDETGIWKRRIERKVGGEPIGYMSPTDLLLHLILHAVYGHRLSNGPLILVDLSCLIRGGGIDWPLFWRLAEAGGWTRSCVLMLKMAQNYFGEMPVDYPASALLVMEDAEALAQSCASLTLNDFQSKHEMKLAAVLAGGLTPRNLLSLLKTAFPPRVNVAASYNANSSWLGVYAGYFSKYWRVISEQLPAMLANRRQYEAYQRDVRKLAELDQWLTPR